ncbi:ABC-type transport auxiliary lipoprotein family protein [Segnochrobactraceae bacterium EtOH-i3]
MTLPASVLRGLAALSLVAVVAGCASSSVPRVLYDLTAPTTFPPAGKVVRGQVLVAEPRALSSLNTNLIAVKPSATTVSYFDRVAWADRLPRLLQARMVEALQNSGRFRAVGVPGDGILVNYQVQTDIRDFELDAATNTVYVALMVRVLDDTTGKVVAQQLFEGRAPATAAAPGKAIEAFDTALDQVLTEVTLWVAARM